MTIILDECTDGPSWEETMDQLAKSLGMGRDPRYYAKVVGQFNYTPAEELRDRLNIRFAGDDPGTPVNTRYWRQ